MNLFIEVDRSEEGHGIWADKVKGAIDFLNSDTYRDIYVKGAKEKREALGYESIPMGVRILTVTTGDLRLRNMMETTVNAGGKQRFWFTTFDECNPTTILTEDIWRIATGEGLHHVTE